MQMPNYKRNNQFIKEFLKTCTKEDRKHYEEAQQEARPAKPLEQGKTKSNMLQCKNLNSAIENNNYCKNRTSSKNGTQLKRKVLLTFLCCVMIATSSFGQFLAGISYGVDAYRWDRIPTDQTEGQKKSSGGIFSENAGLNVGFGNKKYRLLLDGYQNFVPFSFSLNKFQGMGTFSGGAMAKISITPFTYDFDKLAGFSIGVGIEMNKTEFNFRKKDVVREWYPTKYVYLAYSVIKEDGALNQTDIFAKVGKGDYSASNIEFGFRVNLFLLR